MRTPFKISILLLIGAVAMITGCKKPDNNAGTAMLMMHIHTNLGSEEVEEDSVYPNWNNKNIQITRAEYYISGIKLIRTDNSIVTVSGTTLVKWGTEEYMIGNIPAGSYKNVTFDIGVQPTDNHTDPAAQSGDLAAQTPTMHYASNSNGYVFLAVQGLIDSTTGSSMPNKEFSYHIGTDALLKNVSLGDHSVAPYNAPFKAANNGSITVHMYADLNKLFDNVDMAANNTTNSLDVNPSLGSVLAGNIRVNMFSYEE